VVAAAVLLIALGSCGASGQSSGAPRSVRSPAPTASVPASAAPTSERVVTMPSSAPPTAPTTSAATQELMPSSTTTTSNAPGVDPPAERFVIGRSVQGRPIDAIERGRRGGTVVLVIGVIHGDEPAGTAVVDLLERRQLPTDIDLWLVPSMNPDGEAAKRRTNAHLVDLNRNFPRRWAPLDRPGEPEYAGTSAASEPETRAVVSLISLLRPAIVIWYHQDLNRIAPAGGHAGAVRRTYAALTGLPVLPVTGGTYTGTASTWAQAEVEGSVSFIVELGPTLGPSQAERHAAAVLAVART